MKSISQNTANGGFNGNPLRKDYFAASGRRAMNFRCCEIRRQEFCRWLPPISLTVAAKSNRLPEEFCGKDQPTIPVHAKPIQQAAVFQAFPETSFRWGNCQTIRGQGRRPKFAIVRIYYLKTQFTEAFDRILRGQFCLTHCTKRLKNSAILTN
jgi:hypothetical protein